MKLKIQYRNISVFTIINVSVCVCPITGENMVTGSFPWIIFYNQFQLQQFVVIHKAMNIPLKLTQFKYINVTVQDRNMHCVRVCVFESVYEYVCFACIIVCMSLGVCACECVYEYDCMCMTVCGCMWTPYIFILL